MATAVQETRTVLRIAGSDMSVLEAGTGEAVLLGHSFLWDAEMWRPQIETLSRRRRIVVPELWGHGASGALPMDAHGMQDLARHHLAVMDRLGIKRFAVVGLSVGGMWGAALALMAPERVSALVLMDSFAGPEPEGSRQRYFEMLRMIEATPIIPQPVLDAVVPMFFAPDVSERHPNLPRGFRRRLQGWRRDRLLDSVVPLGRMIFGRPDMMSEISVLNMPRLVMCGESDAARPIAESRLMAEALDCPCIAIPAAGHIASLEAPDYVTSQLTTFLDCVSG